MSTGSFALIRLFVMLSTLLFLTACASSPARDARSESDLNVVKLAVEKMAVKRTPTPVDGSSRMEDQETFGNAYLLGLNLEDSLWLSEQDKKSIVEFVQEAMEEIAKTRRPPCKWYNIACRFRDGKAE